MGSRWVQAFDFLDNDSRATLSEQAQRLVSEGVGFLIHVQGTGGEYYRVSGRTVGLQAELDLSPLPAAEAALVKRADAARRAQADAAALLSTMETAPLLMQRVDASGRVVWQTEALRALVDQARDPGQVAAPVAGALDLPLRGGAEPRQLEVFVSDIEGSTDQLVILDDRTALTAARRGLTSFMTAMTETFAHLGSALAVFDEHQSLSLFNPQLSDLFQLDPAALAGRPSLRDFLEALRHVRMLPEQADFAAWRSAFIKEVSRPHDSAQEHVWHLPGGEIIRVTARPHSGGSVVLLFDDISDHVSLERRYRVEIETGQSILDRLGEGIAVFSGSGQVVYCNPAFTDALGFDPFRDMLSGGLQKMIDHASAAFGQSDDWQSFREYALGPERRADWTRVLNTPAGGRLWLRANPLPDGSTMLVVTSAPPDRGAQEVVSPVEPDAREAG